jgi:hypothetical protein
MPRHWFPLRLDGSRKQNSISAVIEWATAKRPALRTANNVRHWILLSDAPTTH